MEKTIKYLENGEYHYATVRSVGDLAQLKTDSKETLVEAINELWNGGGNADPSKAPKPEGYDQLVQDVADAVKNQQEISQQWIEWQKEDAQLTEERKQAYLQAMKEMQESIDKAKADAAALDDKTAKLDEQITKTFSDLDTNIQNMHEQLQKEADRMNQELIDTKSDLTKVRTDLQNAQLDNGRIHDELTNINGKFEHKVWQTDLDPLKEQIDRAETSVQQTKDELLGKASRQDLDTVTNTVSKLDTQLKETAKGVEISVKKDELGGDVARLLNDKTNLLLGTRNFSGSNWLNREYWHEEPGYWNGLKVYSSEQQYYGIQYQYYVKAGNTYTFSLWAKQDVENLQAAFYLLAENKEGIVDPLKQENVIVKTEWTRVHITFDALQDAFIYPRLEQTVVKNKLYVAGYKLELGKNATPWEPNEADIAENIEHTESQFNVYSDQIAGIVKKQEKMGDTERQLDTRITETAEGLKQTSKDLQDANGKITEFKGQLESTARGLKTEYEKYTNDAVGQISDSTLNLIRNSSFQNKDEDFAQWQNISAKANIRQDENGLRWVELTQSGLTTNNPEGITSNYFNIKQGKVTVAVDIKSGDKASLDNDSVLSLELYNDVKKRVDFYDVSLSQLGLSKELLGDHKVHRGLYRLGIDRNDAKYMTVKAKLVKNGDLYFTNFSARLSSIDDGAYEPNPDDINQQILKQNTKIEQNAKEVAIKANSVDVTRDIKSAVDGIKVGTSNLLHHSDTFDGWHKGASVSIANEKYLNGTVAILNNSGSGGNALDSVLDITNEEKYVTWTVYAKADNAGDKLHTELWGGGGYTDQPLTTKWQRYKFAGNHADSNHSFYLWGVNSNKGKIYVALPFAVIGNATGTWMPNAEDTSAEIKSAKDAAIKVASDQINIHVNEISTQFDDKLNKRINEAKTASEKFTSDGIEQVVTKVTNVKGDVDKVSNSLSNLDQQVKNNNGGGINLLKATDFANTDMDTLRKYWGSSFTIRDGVALQVDGLALKSGSADATQVVQVDPDTDYTLSFEVHNNAVADGGNWNKIQTFLWEFKDSETRKTTDKYTDNGRSVVNTNKRNDNIQTIHTQPDCHYIRVIFRANPKVLFSFVKPKLERGNTTTPWTVSPEDTAQLISDTNKKIDTQILDSANIDNLKTQGHYFVKNLTGNPIGGWVYVDVTGNNNDRVKQDVYQDNGGKHMSRRLFGNSWSGWEQGAYISDVNNVKTEVTASVKNLGDRVTTEVNSITTRMSDQIANAVELIQKSDFSDGSKGSWTVQSIISATNPAPPAELGISGMKVIQSNVRDSYEDVWHSVTPGEKFNVDFWCAPSGVYDSSFGLVFYDANKKLVPNNQWLGVRTDHSGQWRHYTGEITAPSNSAFARPWFQIDMPADQHNTSWLAKPHIRRQDPRVTEAIKEVNAKWDVANGQIQGKVTATDVNNIINGKGYATQSWAQTMFQMKSNSITLQAVRDNITNGIQNQVNDTRNQINGLQNQFNTQTGINLLKGTADFSGPWFNKNGKGWSYNGDWQPPTSENKSERNNNVVYQDSGHAWDGLGQTVELNTGEYTFSMWMWPTLSGNESMNIYVGDSQYGGTAKVNYSGYSYSASQPQNRWILVKTYLTVTQGGKLSIRPELNQASGTIHVASYMLQHGHVENPVWAPAPDDLAPKSIISSINITPDQIKIASNKIVIDGNTDIHGVLRVPEVRLQGKSGMIGLDGNKGIIISSADTLFQTRVTKFGMDFLTTTNGQKEIMGGITTGFSTNNGNLNGISIVLDTQQKLGYPYGGDFFSIGNTTSIVNDDNRSWSRAMDYDASGQLHQGGFMWYEKSYLTGEGQNIYVGGVRGNGNSAYDPILIGTHQWDKAAQSNVPQPLITLGYGGTSNSNSGLGLVWNQMKPYGNWDITDVNDIWYDGQHFRFTWVSHPEMMSNASCPAFIRLDSNGAIASGISFAWGSVWAMGAAGGGNIVKLLL